MKPPHCSRALLIVAAIAANAATPTGALGATYVVTACDVAPDGFTNDSWTYSESVAGRFDHASGCSDPPGGEYAGLYLRDTLNIGTNAPSGTSAYWTFAAPATTTISAITYSRHLRTFGDDGWRAELLADNSPLEVCQTSGIETQCDRGTTGGASVSFSGLIAAQLQVGGRCAPQAPATSCTHGGTLHRLITTIYGASVTLSDTTFPSVSTMGGSIAAGGWLRGPQTVTASGSDATGVSRLELLEGSAALRDDQRSCDYTKPAPCTNPGGQVDASWAPLNTATLTDGSHLLRVRVRDAAGNATESSSISIDTDNTAPAAPVSLAAGGGSAWSPTATRALAWALPSGQAAPITGAIVTSCLAVSCTTTAAPSTTSASVELPSPGEWTAAVHLADEAGNTDQANAATVTLRYDPDAPAAPTLGGPQPGQTSSFPSFSVPITISDPGPAPLELPVAELCHAGGSACAGVDGEQANRVDFTVPGPGTWMLRVRARDAAGNLSDAASTTVNYMPAEPSPTPSVTPTPTASATPAPSPTATPTPTPSPARRRPSIRIDAARHAHSGLRVRGSLDRTATGSVKISFSVKRGNRTRSFARRIAIRAGRFAGTLRLPRSVRGRRGTVRIRYPGDSRFLPRTASTRVAADTRVAAATT